MKSNPDVTLSIAQATADARHGIVKMVNRMIAKNKRERVGNPQLVNGDVLNGKILKMDELAKLKPGGEGQRRVR